MDSVENYKLLFYSSPLPIIIYDLETLQILDINKMAAEFYGYSRDEFLRMTIKDIRPPEEIPLLIEALKEMVFSDSEVNSMGIWNHIKKSGQPVKVEIAAHPMNYKNRNCLMVTCNDVTDKTNALRALQISNERFEYATKATSDIIWDWNLETNEVYYSGNINNLFGHTAGFTNDNLPFYFEHVHPDDRERVVLYPDQVKYGKMINWTQEYRFRKANGEYAFVLDKGIVIRDKEGIGLRMIGAMQDITVLKQNELRIMRQNEQLMEIASINAHEIRRPVASILGLMQLINKATIKNEANRELLTHLETATRELDEIIKRIIDKTAD
jgi:PAS domain S-box-containing protein